MLSIFVIGVGPCTRPYARALFNILTDMYKAHTLVIDTGTANIFMRKYLAVSKLYRCLASRGFSRHPPVHLNSRLLSPLRDLLCLMSSIVFFS
jgi:hypothetical protein